MSRPKLAMGALGIAFLIAAFGIGAFGLREEYFVFPVMGALGVWAWTRQEALARLTFLQRAIKGFIAFAVIGFVLVAALELGKFLGGHS